MQTHTHFCHSLPFVQNPYLVLSASGTLIALLPLSSDGSHRTCPRTLTQGCLVGQCLDTWKGSSLTYQKTVLTSQAFPEDPDLFKAFSLWQP